MQLSMLGNDMIITSAKARYIGYDYNPGSVFMGVDPETPTPAASKGTYDTLITPTISTINQLSPTALSWYSTITGKPVNPQAPAGGAAAPGMNKSILIAAGVVGAAVVVLVVMKKKRRR